MSRDQPIPISRMWLGSTEQPPWASREGSVKRALNCRFDVTSGAVKRNATEHVADIAKTGKQFIASMRSAFIFVDNAGAVSGVDKDGTALTVTDGTGGAMATYLASGSMDVRFRIESTWLFNTMVVVNREVEPETEATYTFQQSLNFFLTGDKTDGTHGTTVTEKASVADFSELPPTPTAGDVHLCETDFQLDPAGYYLYPGDDPDASYPAGYFPQHGDWLRIPASAVAEGAYKPSTMPHRIFYDRSAGELLLTTIPWKQRLSGQDFSNAPAPWAVEDDQTLPAVRFHSDRLFLIGKSHVTASRKDDYFNFWNDNVNAIADDDRIIRTIETALVGDALRVGTCTEALIVACERGPLEFTSGENALTNTNGRVKIVGSYPLLDIPIGNNGLDAVLIDRFDNVHMFRQIDPVTGIRRVLHMNAHMPRLLKDVDPVRIDVTADTAWVMTEQGKILMHDSFGAAAEIVQSAWGEYELLDSVVFADTDLGNIRFVTKSEETYSLLQYAHRRLPAPDPLLYLPNMDRVEVITPAAMTYTPIADETVMSHADKSGIVQKSAIVLTQEGRRHEYHTAFKVNESGDPVFKGKFDEANVYLGFRFDAELELTKFYPGVAGYGVNFKEINVFHLDSVEYGIRVEFTSGQEFEDFWQAYKIGEVVIGEPSFDTGMGQFAVKGDTREMTVTLFSTAPGPVEWTALEYVVLPKGRGGGG